MLSSFAEEWVLLKEGSVQNLFFLSSGGALSNIAKHNAFPEFFKNVAKKSVKAYRPPKQTTNAALDSVARMLGKGQKVVPMPKPPLLQKIPGVDVARGAQRQIRAPLQTAM